MEIKSFSDMREIIIENFRKKTLIPIIGSDSRKEVKALRDMFLLARSILII